MNPTHNIRAMEPGEEKEVQTLIGPIFDEFVAPLFSKEGIDEFYSVLKSKYINRQAKKGTLYLFMEDEKTLEKIGIISVKHSSHISLFFIKKGYQGRGLGKKLLLTTIEWCRKIKPDIEELTVNASPNAVDVYRMLRFEKIEEEQEHKGIRFTKMKRILENQYFEDITHHQECNEKQ